MELWLDQFYVDYLKKGNSIISDELLNPTNSLYKFCDMTRLEPEPIALVSHTNEKSQVLHERLRHLNFLSMQSLMT
jgi:hypothetical protein